MWSAKELSFKESWQPSTIVALMSRNRMAGKNDRWTIDIGDCESTFWAKKIAISRMPLPPAPLHRLRSCNKPSEFRPAESPSRICDGKTCARSCRPSTMILSSAPVDTKRPVNATPALDVRCCSTRSRTAIFSNATTKLV